MQDRPNAVELVGAVKHFLECEMLPMLEDQRARFRTLVAVNALAIVQRELSAGLAPVELELERLHALLHAQPGYRDKIALSGDKEYDVRKLRLLLARLIRVGAADGGPWRKTVIASTLASVEAKVCISNPKFIETRNAH